MAVPDRFGAEEARAYDERASRSLPGYEVMHELAAAQLAARLPGHAELLVVGAGTGAELAALAPAQPGWRFTAVDPAAPMLAVAREKAATTGYADRVDFRTGYVADLPAGARFHGAAMMLVAHFVPVAGGAKAALFRAVAQRLRPGAPLVFADLATPAAPDSVAAQARRRVAMAHGWSAADADLMVKHVHEQLYPVDGADLDRLLAAAGFTPAEPFFQSLGYRAWLTRRRNEGGRP